MTGANAGVGLRKVLRIRIVRSDQRCEEREDDHQQHPRKRQQDTAAAEEARTAIPPFSDSHSDIDIETAYAAQWEFVQSKLDAGEQLTGAKLGLTSRAKQEAMNVAEPLYGWITSGMIVDYGGPVDRSSLIHPRAEPEIAFLLGRDVTATIANLAAYVEAQRALCAD